MSVSTIWGAREISDGEISDGTCDANDPVIGGRRKVTVRPMVREAARRLVEWYDVYAKAKIEGWRVDYNQHRPHSALGHLTPNEYAQQRQKSGADKVAFL